MNKSKTQTPTLNKKQQKITLSAKKQKKATVKNVLATPFSNYWPLLKPEDHKILTESLEKCLPRIRSDKINIPWKEIKDVPKNERKAFRERYSKLDKTKLECIERNQVILGVNEVTAALEKRILTSVLIASDVTPKFMIKHVIDMSVLYNVPVLVVTDLRIILQKCCGISSAVLAVKNTIDKDMKLFQLNQTIKAVSDRYPVPKNHINFKRRLEQMATDEKTVIDQNLVDKSVDIGDMTVEEDKSRHVAANEEKNYIDCSEKQDEDDDDDAMIKQFYLTRKSETNDAFVPRFSGCGNIHCGKEMDVDTDFITFERPITSNLSNTKQSGKVSYKSLVIKRLKGDVNRNKRKIDKLKQK